MRTTQIAPYVVMAIWMLLGASARVALQIIHGYPLDVLPFIGSALAATALILVSVTHRIYVGLYIALAVWLLFGSFARVALQLTGNQSLDVIPLVSVLIGLTALIVLFGTQARTRGGI